MQDADLQAKFDANKETYRIGEKRKVKYALLDVEKVRETVQVPDADVEAFYTQNKAQYSTEGRVRASHILLKTEGKDEAAVRAKAEGLLAQAKAPGADFAALAKAWHAWVVWRTRPGLRSAWAKAWSVALPVACLTLLWVAVVFHLIGTSLAS